MMGNVESVREAACTTPPVARWARPLVSLGANDRDPDHSITGPERG